MIAPFNLSGRGDLLAAALRRDLISFIRKTFATASPSVDYVHGWHIEAMAWHLNEVACGRMQRLIITMPPRNLKSIISSVALPAFVLGHDPTRRIVAVSYAADLAAKHSADYRAVMRAQWYHEIFPATVIDRKKDTELEIRTTARGSPMPRAAAARPGRFGRILPLRCTQFGRPTASIYSSQEGRTRRAVTPTPSNGGWLRSRVTRFAQPGLAGPSTVRAYYRSRTAAFPGIGKGITSSFPIPRPCGGLRSLRRA